MKFARIRIADLRDGNETIINFITVENRENSAMNERLMNVNSGSLEDQLEIAVNFRVVFDILQISQCKRPLSKSYFTNKV